jgi:hypothetical protein
MKFTYAIALFLVCSLSVSISFAGTDSGHKAADASHGGKSDPTKLFPQPKMNKSKTTPPKKTDLIEPAFMAQIPGTSVTLKWNAVDTAENYHLQVATDSTFKWLKVNEHFVKRPSYDLSQLEPGKIYYWRVAAVKNSNDPMYIKGPFETSSFETK